MALLKKKTLSKPRKPAKGEKEQRLTIQPVGGPWLAKSKKAGAKKKERGG